jgi:hypothetical protein
VSQIPEYVVRMVRRSMPEGCSIVPASTPVVSFGDPTKARVATLGINPSDKEFLDKDGNLLVSSKQRLATLPFLGASRCEDLTDEQVQTVVEWCNNYFQCNWYKKWFGPIEQWILPRINASYMDGSACHLDLIQWSTSPVWQNLNQTSETRKLLDDGIEHLKAQLATENITTVIALGRTVWDQLLATKMCYVIDESKISICNGKASSTLRIGEGTGTRFVGWTSNLQSQPLTKGDRETLGNWLASVFTEK